MRNAKDFWRTDQMSTIGTALLVSVALLALGVPGIPSLAAAMPTTCEMSPEVGCCACYTTKDGTYRCHGRAWIGAQYCDDSTKFCGGTVCWVPE